MLAGMLAAHETLMGLCCASALSYRVCVNGQQGSAQEKCSTPAPRLEGSVSLPPYAGSTAPFRGVRALLKPCKDLVSCPSWWLLAMLGAQLLESLSRGRERKKRDISQKSLNIWFFHSCREAHWWEGCLRPIWRGEGWPGAAAADLIPCGHSQCLRHRARLLHAASPPSNAAGNAWPLRTRLHMWGAPCNGWSHRGSKQLCLLPSQFTALSFPQKHRVGACKSFSSIQQRAPGSGLINDIV